MRTAKQMAGTLVVLLLAAAMGGGCCMAPPRPPPPRNTQERNTQERNTQARSIQWVDPAPDGYYTGARPNFANRANPDPAGRKFRLAFLRIRIHSVDGKTDGGMVKAVAQSTMRGLDTGYLPLRKRERDRARGMGNPDNNAPGDNIVKLEQSYFAYEKSMIDYANATARYKQRGVFGEPVPRGFAHHWDDMDYLNAELASRYPALFTTSWSGFPVEIAMVALYTEKSPEVRTRFEAWLVGLPDNPNGAGMPVFMPTEAFLDPYDAIAAAFFKLTDAQFRGLEATEPGDHRWLEKE